MIPDANNEKNTNDEELSPIIRRPRIMRPTNVPPAPSLHETVGQILSQGLSLQQRLHTALAEGEAAQDTPAEKLAHSIPAIEPLVKLGNFLLRGIETARKLARDRDERDRRNSA